MGTQSTWGVNLHQLPWKILDRGRQGTKMLSKLVVALLLVSIQLALYVDQAEGMGICFGGGYPACCQGGKNTCGPLCASCSRVSEFLRMMMMFGGIGPGTPAVFRTINPDPHKDAGQDVVPFPAAPFPVNGGRRPRTRGRRPRSLRFPLKA